MTGAVSSINCTNCGAGLQVLGGGRVVTQVCGYCGARLDANDAYKVLSVNAEMERPNTPFTLGMTGEIEGVTFTIIGIIGLYERWEGETWRWVDHMLYSPTHGYQWLTLEDGHTILTRKTRDWPGGAFLVSHVVNTMEARPSVTWRGEHFKYYASSSWRVDFVEGEFNWRPDLSTRGSTVTLANNGDPLRMLSYVNGEEREVEVSTYFPQAAATFGAEPPRPQGVHPLQPYSAKDGKSFYALWFGALTAAAVVVAILVGALTGEKRVLFDGAPANLPPALTFEVTDTVRPVRIQMFQNLAQAWAEYDVTLRDPAGTLLAETGRGISYYYGGRGENAWTEGSRFAALTFAPTVAGTYTVDLALAEAATPQQAQIPVRVFVQEGRGNALWSWIVAGLFGMAFLWTMSSRMRHRMARWKGSDWSDDD